MARLNQKSNVRGFHMETLFYEENTIELFRYLKRNTPKHIFSDEYQQVVFDYGSFHIAAFPEDSVAVSRTIQMK